MTRRGLDAEAVEEFLWRARDDDEDRRDEWARQMALYAFGAARRRGRGRGR